MTGKTKLLSASGRNASCMHTRHQFVSKKKVSWGDTRHASRMCVSLAKSHDAVLMTCYWTTKVRVINAVCMKQTLVIYLCTS